MYSLEELQQIKQDTITELQKASEGITSSFPFITHQLPNKPAINQNEIFQVIVIGGTLFKTALVKKSNDTITIIEQSQEVLPIFHTKEIFLEFLIEKINKTVNHIGINFAYPLKPIKRNDSIDGILMQGSKEHTFDGLIGETIGETIEKYLAEKRQQIINVAIANDTICLLLSGVSSYKWDQLAAVIVGTGFNSALFIEEYYAVNLESANFNKFTQSPEGLEIDQNSKSPKHALFEKEISGAYLYQHYNLQARKNNSNLSLLSSTEELNTLLDQNNSLAQSVMQHSALLVSVHIAGLTDFLKRDLQIIMQGSLFWEAYGYKKIVEESVKKLTDFNVNYVSIKDSDILGAIALLNY